MSPALLVLVRVSGYGDSDLCRCQWEESSRGIISARARGKRGAWRLARKLALRLVAGVGTDVSLSGERREDLLEWEGGLSAGRDMTVGFLLTATFDGMTVDKSSHVHAYLSASLMPVSRGFLTFSLNTFLPPFFPRPFNAVLSRETKTTRRRLLGSLTFDNPRLRTFPIPLHINKPPRFIPISTDSSFVSITVFSISPCETKILGVSGLSLISREKGRDALLQILHPHICPDRQHLHNPSHYTCCISSTHPRISHKSNNHLRHNV